MTYWGRRTDIASKANTAKPLPFSESRPIRLSQVSSGVAVSIWPVRGAGQYCRCRQTRGGGDPVSGGAEGHYTAGRGEIRRTPITDRAWPQATTTWVSSSSNSVARRRPKPVAPSGCPLPGTGSGVSGPSISSLAALQCPGQPGRYSAPEGKRRRSGVIPTGCTVNRTSWPPLSRRTGVSESRRRYEVPVGRSTVAGWQAGRIARLLELAVAHKQSALKSTPNHPEYLWTLGFVQENLGLELYRMERLR